MDSSEPLVSRSAINRQGLRLLAFPLLLITLWLILGSRYGFLIVVLVGGFISAMITLPIAFYKGILEPLLRGVQCPCCREWSLVRVSCISFGYRFYRCDYCGQRCKRLDHESPWVDSSGMDDDDMYKPVPFFGPVRQREATFCALKALGTVAAIFLIPLIGWLLGGESVGYFGSVIAVVIVVASTQRDEKKIIPILPILWDREIDQ
jgi:hypothetical protein